MKSRNQLHLRRDTPAIDTAPSHRPEISPNSSAILAVTVLAGIDDVSAVIRTATLLGNSFKIPVSIHIPGENVLQMEPGESVPQEALEDLFVSIRSRLCAHQDSRAQMFTLEANITAASFLTAGAIAVHVGNTESVPRQPARFLYKEIAR